MEQNKNINDVLSEKIDESANEISKSTYNFFKSRVKNELKKLSENNKSISLNFFERMIIFSISNVLQNILINLCRSVEVNEDQGIESLSSINLPRLAELMNSTFHLTLEMLKETENDEIKRKMN